MIRRTATFTLMMASALLAIGHGGAARAEHSRPFEHTNTAIRVTIAASGSQRPPTRVRLLAPGWTVIAPSSLTGIVLGDSESFDLPLSLEGDASAADSLEFMAIPPERHLQVTAFWTRPCDRQRWIMTFLTDCTRAVSRVAGNHVVAAVLQSDSVYLQVVDRQ